MKKPQPLTIVVLTRNAEDYLDNCLESAQWADELIVIDSGSTDATESIARKHNVRLLFREWEGYGAQVQNGLDIASNRWVFILDHDEVIDHALAVDIREVLSTNSRFTAYKVKRKNRLMGKWLRYGGMVEVVPRLISRDRVRSVATQHNKLTGELRYGRLRGCLHHYMAPSVSQWFTRSIVLARIEAEDDYLKGARFSGLLLLSSLWKFFRRYTFKLGFLDGWAGLVAALQRAVYRVLYQATLLELQNKVRTLSSENRKYTFR